MNITVVCCTIKVGYQRYLAALLADWRRDKSVTNVPDTACLCLHEDWSQLWLVVYSRYWSHEHHIEKRLRM